LRDGRAIKPLRAAWPTGCSYYLVYPAGLPLSKPASAFCHWLKKEAGDFRKKL
jgi:DNA-binding transcriptional LysR family regulator